MNSRPEFRDRRRQGLVAPDLARLLLPGADAVRPRVDVRRGSALAPACVDRRLVMCSKLVSLQVNGHPSLLTGSSDCWCRASALLGKDLLLRSGRA